jgi:hypothetical protein
VPDREQRRSERCQWRPSGFALRRRVDLSQAPVDRAPRSAPTSRPVTGDHAPSR